MRRLWIQYPAWHLCPESRHFTFVASLNPGVQWVPDGMKKSLRFFSIVIVCNLYFNHMPFCILDDSFTLWEIKLLAVQWISLSQAKYHHTLMSICFLQDFLVI